MVSRELIEGERERTEDGVEEMELKELLLAWWWRARPEGNASLYFCGPRLGLDDAEPELMFRMVFWSITLAGKEVGACCAFVGALAKLCSGEAGRRLREPEREKDALAAAAGCWRGVISSSLSSWIISIAPPDVAVLSYQLGDRGGGA